VLEVRPQERTLEDAFFEMTGLAITPEHTPGHTPGHMPGQERTS
jgi:glyoxylase-like metal-dependent hydrolase (beta-lactamase superfamily II)